MELAVSDFVLDASSKREEPLRAGRARRIGRVERTPAFAEQERKFMFALKPNAPRRHRRAGVTGVRLLNRVHRQGTDCVYT